MAIDSKDKRWSALNTGQGGTATFPKGSIPAASRATLIGRYEGIAAAIPADVAGTATGMNMGLTISL